MASKRPPSPDLIQNPFIKKRNLKWRLEVPVKVESHRTECGRTPPEGQQRLQDDDDEREPASTDAPSHPNISAALESGAASRPDPATHFFAHLARHTPAPYPPGTPHLTADASLRDLFLSHAGSRRGAHFVVHQHDHPIAGLHYDLRLQVNETSSVSWAVMYGLPGDPNSKRLNRNATETRVHCLWNHVVETASGGTGSLLVWDCGRFEVLESRGSGRGLGPAVDPDSGEEGDVERGGGVTEQEKTEQEKLAIAFAERKIRVMLHGSRLPERYVLNLRLTKAEDADGRGKSDRALQKPKRKRRRGGGHAKKKQQNVVETSSEGSSGDEGDGDLVPDPLGEASGIDDEEKDNKGLSAMEQEIRELEDDHVRRTNAYKGAKNSVGSVYQRRWYLSLDREGCGFERRYVGGKRVWTPLDSKRGGGGGGRGGGEGNREGPGEVDKNGRLRFPFYVRGSEVERSVVTGRKGDEILSDEGVMGFIRRKGWRPVMN